MRFRNFLFASLIAFSAPMMVGCGSSCEDLCEEGKDEDCDDFEAGDCLDFCQNGEELNEKADCEDDFDKYVSCLSDQDDICDAFGDGDNCEDEVGDYGDCVADYCIEHPTNDSCEWFIEQATGG